MKEVMINIGSVSLFLLSFNKPYNVAVVFGCVGTQVELQNG